MSLRRSARVLVLFAAAPSALRAQGAVGMGDDVTMPAAGALRVRATNEWTRYDRRYATGLGRRPAGTLEPLGADYTLDSLGPRQLPQLASVQSRLRTLSRNPSFPLTLGNSVANADASVVRTPISLEVGLTSRLAVGVMVPYVRTRTVVRVDVNPSGTQATVGLNPLLGADAQTTAATNGQLYGQFAASAAALSQLVASCMANPAASPRCPQILANPAAAAAVVSDANGFAGLLRLVYGGGGTTFSPVVPVAGSATEAAIEAQIDTLSQRYQRYLGGFPPIALRPVAAAGPFALADANTLVLDSLSTAGIRSGPLTTIERSHLGDIELGAKVLLLGAATPDSGARARTEVRSALTGILRLGTGQTAGADDFLAIGTGDGTTALEVRSATEVRLGGRFSAAVNARYAWPKADRQTLRITDTPGQILAAYFRRQNVARQLGHFYELELDPRYTVNASLAFSGFYLYRQKSPDQYSHRVPVDSATTGSGAMTLDAASLGLATGATEHRLGGGFTYSSLPLYGQRRASLPVDVTFLHYETVRASGGGVPKRTTDQVSIRLYYQLLRSRR